MVLLKNGSDMVEILGHLHQYVPAKEYTREIYIPSISETVLEQKAEVRQLLFGGDQLTVARARRALKAMCNATTTTKRLEGIIPVVDVIWKYVFDTQSAREHATSSKTSSIGPT